MRFAKMSVAGAAFALAGCAGVDPDALIDALPGGVTPAAPALAMFNGSVQAVGPVGFCADPDSSRPKRGFAIFASCATLKVESANAVQSALTTVQFGPAQSAIVGQDAAGFVSILKGPDGPVLLSRSGDANTVEILEVREGDDHVAVYLRDKTPAYIDGVQESEWRAFLDIAGRLATVSVRGLDAAPLDSATGAALLDQAVAALIAANSRSEV